MTTVTTATISMTTVTITITVSMTTEKIKKKEFKPYPALDDIYINFFFFDKICILAASTN